MDYTGRIKLLALLILCSVSSILNAQNDSFFGWVNTLGGPDGFEEGNCITTDINGNVLTSGFFGAFNGGTVEFDLGDTTINLTSIGNADMYIHKLDSSGNLIWIRQFGGISGEQALSVTTDISGNVYVTGIFGDTVDFDPGPATANLVAEVGDAFILKLDSSGNFIWAKQIEGVYLQKGLSITTDNNGNVLTSGIFENTTDFDPGTGVNNLTSVVLDGFVLKLDSNGNFIWARQIGGTGNDYATSLITDTVGNVYVTGHENDYSNMFIRKFDEDGNLMWTDNIAATISGFSNSITIDPNGDLYTTGQFYGTADFDPGTGVTNLLSNNTDIFILKLTSDGEFIWVKQIGEQPGTPQGNQAGKSITADTGGNLYLTGWFQGAVDFDPDAGTGNLTSTNNGDVYILKLTRYGDFVSVKHIVSSWGCSGIYIATDENDNVYTTGVYRETTDFDPGPGTVNHTSFNIATGSDAFSLKLSYCGTVSAMDTTTCEPYTWTNGITYTSSGVYRRNLTNSAGCDSLLILHLTVNTVDASVNQLNEATLSANAADAVFQWLDCSNDYAEISGETGTNFTAEINGSYAVFVNGNNGCKDTSQCIVIDELGLSDTKPVDEIRIIPNPTNGVVTLYSEHSLNDYRIYLYTPDGELIKKYTFNGVNSSDLMIEGSAGIYLLKVESGTVSQTYRICKLK